MPWNTSINGYTVPLPLQYKIEYSYYNTGSHIENGENY